MTNAVRTCAVLSIGTELTRGELVNTNASWLGAALTELGFEVTEQVVVDDDHDRIVEVVRRLMGRHAIVISTGGLGPTSDDLTTVSVADAIGVGVERDEASLDHIRRRLERFGRAMSETNAKQADFPIGARVLSNAVGTAPGFEVSHLGARAFFLPGVPREMAHLFEEHVAKSLRAEAPRASHQIRLRTFGLPESVVGERLAGVELAFPGITIGYRAHFPEIEVKVLARLPHEADSASAATKAHDLAERASQEVRARLSDVIYGGGDDTFAGVVGRALRNRGLTLAVAESCTGGLVGHMLTASAGASEFLLLDAVTYANSAKQRVLGVDEEVLRGHGAVSAEVACRMAEGARRIAGSDLALSVTGVAGPGGGSDAKPVGLVFLAVASGRGTSAFEHRFSGDRARIQTLAAYTGLALIRAAAEGNGPA